MLDDAVDVVGCGDVVYRVRLPSGVTAFDAERVEDLGAFFVDVVVLEFLSDFAGGGSGGDDEEVVGFRKSVSIRSVSPVLG